ncbi:MAG: hypothetical protein HOD64_07825 [Candidatus Cloacimonetes bacterium]|jgi:DNA-binding response OmpR family regulator|nr:hypothetical protein [Candidatus Cloacimonadota bacterium]
MRKMIIIVEDEVMLSAWLKIQLEDEGYEVCSSFTTGEEAVEFVQNTKPVEIWNLKPIFESVFN